MCYAEQQSERGIRRHRYDTVAEGIGLDRLTANFQRALIDDAVRVTDQEALDMAHYVLHHEGGMTREARKKSAYAAWASEYPWLCAAGCPGLFVGSSTAMNLVGAVVTARALGPGHTIVTVLCDGGQRHLTR